MTHGTWIERVASQAFRRLLLLPRPAKRAVTVGADLVAIPLLMWSALSLDAGEPLALEGHVLVLCAAAALFTAPVLGSLGLYRAVLRFVGPRVGLAIALGTVVTTSLLWLASSLGLLAPLGAAALVIYGALLAVYVGASRALPRWLLLVHREGHARVIIYGAGDAGAGLAAALATSQQYLPVAFVDDHAALQGMLVSGVKVHSPERLPELLRLHGVKRILLAMPVLSRRRRREILSKLEPLGVHVQTMPSIGDLVHGRASVDDVQDVDAADLLGRDPVPPDDRLLRACISGKSVLVTGAGGSIGSELCRQILRLGPTRLLLLEMSELALYNIDRELRRTIDSERLDVDLVPLIGSAHHKYRVRELLQTFEVQTVYHAAAYKHVPIVEHNVIEGIHNNVISTWYTAEAALECGVETFVLISTDKAVNPTNVMGATKRFAEIVLQGLQQRSNGTRFCMVRFGNVLESSGSVVPLFREQIRRGGPVTVTHPDVTRYFMTIPEASQLVIQAGSMAKGGDVFVLDMGKPIRIDDLARRMIQLSGLTVRESPTGDGDILIRYTGLRPAEKLYEELLIGGNVTGTEHAMIMRAVEHALPWNDVQQILEQVGIAMRRFDCRSARELLKHVVAEYRPESDLQDLVWTRRNQAESRAGDPLPSDPKVTDLKSRRAKTEPQSSRPN